MRVEPSTLDGSNRPWLPRWTVRYTAANTMTPLESKLREFLSAGAPEVAAAYLFGSVSRGDARVDSDVDLAVLLSEEPGPGLDGLELDLAAALERVLARSVDLVVLNRAPPDLVHRVLRDGRLLVDRDPSRRIRFEVKARNEYFDLQPLRARYRGYGAKP